MVTQIQRENSVVRHHASKDLRVHSRDLESILFPLRVECVNGVLQVMVPRAFPAHQRLPSSVGSDTTCHTPVLKGVN
jgi:hypothetical protein